MAKKETTALATASTNTGITMSNEKMFEMYRDVVAPGTNLTATEFGWYVHYCQQRGFDPLGKEIYLVPRKSKQPDGSYKTILTPQSSIDAFRKRATQSNAYEGQVGPFWCGPDGVWKDIWLLKTPPTAAKVGVSRQGFREPAWGIALYSEYVQTDSSGRPTQFWTKMPANQLAKCAESLALRKAFPDQFGGVYTAEEMAQADIVDVVPETRQLHAVTEDTQVEIDEMDEAYSSTVSQPTPTVVLPPRPVKQAKTDDPPIPTDDDMPTPFDDLDEPPVKKAVLTGPPTAREIAALKAAWKAAGIKPENAQGHLDLMAGGRKSSQWTRADFENLRSFLGNFYKEE